MQRALEMQMYRYTVTVVRMLKEIVTLSLKLHLWCHTLSIAVT